MTTSHPELAQMIVADGFNAHSSGLDALITDARLRSVNETLLEIVADAGAPRVARERALGNIIAAITRRPREQSEHPRVCRIEDRTSGSRLAQSLSSAA